MHILFIHQNYPAQFGHIATYLVRKKGFRCTFLSQHSPGTDGGVERIQYKLRGGATSQTHFCSASFENATWHSHAIFEALKARPDIRPDLVVAHSGYFFTVWLRDLFACPIINYFEYYYRTTGPDLDRRPEFPYPEINQLRRRRETLPFCSTWRIAIRAIVPPPGSEVFCRRPSTISCESFLTASIRASGSPGGT